MRRIRGITQITPCGVGELQPHFAKLEPSYSCHHPRDICLNAKMPQCKTCHRKFGTKEACKQHMDEKHHQKPTKKCDQCNKLFKDRSAAEAHMTQVGHWNPRIPCETCPIKFHTQEAAKQHMAAKNHFKKYCKPCDQKFSSENDLKMVGDYS